jgi:hypothetical protein
LKGGKPSPFLLAFLQQLRGTKTNKSHVSNREYVR